jgi:hypothetical protein
MCKILFFVFLSNLAFGQNRMFQTQNGNVKINPENAPNIISNGLVLNLDASNTISYAGSGTTWTDLSGSGNHGTLINSPTYNSSNGGYFVFNGSTQYVSFTPTKLPTGTSDRSIIAFVSTPTSLGGLQHMIHWGTTSASQAFGLALLNSQLNSHIWNSPPAQVATVFAATNYFFAVTYTHAHTLHKFWINGFSQGSGISSAINTGTAEARIAQRITGAEDMGANGQIYQVLVYNRALSDDEILQNFNA